MVMRKRLFSRELRITGATRYRLGPDGTLILQVQYIYTYSIQMSFDDTKYYSWRDASVIDLQILMVNKDVVS